MTALWHPFADMASVEALGELVLTRGIGCTVWDDSGRSYLDATAGLWFANVGHGRRSIAQAVAEQAERLAAHSTFGDVANPPALALAERVAGLAPVPDSKVFFTSGGSDSVDTAVKMVRQHAELVGHPERRVVVVRDRAYHGMHLAGTALSGIDANQTGYGALDPDVVRVPWDDAGALAETLDRLEGRAVAFFCEPVIGAGGVFAAGEEYLRAVQEACRVREVLFVADEVICGFGRLGDWFASGRYGLQPDLLLVAKGITSGYVPLGAAIAAPSVWEPFWSRAGVWRHGYTYSGHAVAAAAAMANLDLMALERLPERALAMESVLAQVLEPLRDHPAVSDVRAGTGLLAAVQLADAAHVPAAVAALRERQVLTRGIVTGSLQISPALVVEERQLTVLATAITESLDSLSSAG
ncbi:MAG TPA: aminotransferase class III-fold pyridoxal phosphate-dependent enzyme [Dermatophilaceae bacterium]|nr:aminotransferase class III-fold pyridoxal phosphate-dependent enzyme [Dermatophilaceae bacterium]